MSFRSDRRSSGDGRPYGGGRSSGEGRSFGGGRPGGGGRPSGGRPAAGGRPYRGRTDRDRRFDREGSSEAEGRFNRSDRFNKADRFSKTDRFNKSDRFERGDRSERPGRFNRDERPERGPDQGGRARFDRFDRKAGPGGSGRFERNDRFEGKGRFDRNERGEGKGRFDRQDRFEGRGDGPSRGGDRPDRFERGGSRFSSSPERSRPGRHDSRGGPRRGGWSRDDARSGYESAQPQGEELSHAPDAQADDMLWGRHATQAALEAGRPIHRIWCTPEVRSSPKFLQLLREAKASGVLVEEVTWARLGQLTGGAVHQGIALQTASAETLDLPSLVEGCAALGEPPLLLALDGLTDPHNLGAIVRSAEALGAHGVVLPQRRSAGLTGSVAKVAAGALEHLPVARVVNLNRSLDSLKDAGYRVVGLAGEGDVTLAEADLEGPLVIVTGSEGQGLSLLTRRHCDQLIRIPLRGVTPSLNASVATAMCLYEVARRGWMKDLKGQAPSPPIVRPRVASKPEGAEAEREMQVATTDESFADNDVADATESSLPDVAALSTAGVDLAIELQDGTTAAEDTNPFQDSVEL